jgi:hypothetical protein
MAPLAIGGVADRVQIAQEHPRIVDIEPEISQSATRSGWRRRGALRSMRWTSPARRRASRRVARGSARGPLRSGRARRVRIGLTANCRLRIACSASASSAADICSKSLRRITSRPDHVRRAWRSTSSRVGASWRCGLPDNASSARRCPASGFRGRSSSRLKLRRQHLHQARQEIRIAPEHREDLVKDLQMLRPGDQRGPEDVVEIDPFREPRRRDRLDRGFDLCRCRPSPRPSAGLREMQDVLDQAAVRILRLRSFDIRKAAARLVQQARRLRPRDPRDVVLVLQKRAHRVGDQLGRQRHGVQRHEAARPVDAFGDAG